MPSRRRSRSIFEEPEDEDENQQSGFESSKRRRRHESQEEEEEEEELDEDEEVEDDGFASQDDYQTAANEYSPGAVVRVKLVNFVTYEKAVFFPGPNLNMIIGPNGTGKSSLVCALALGLGYPTNVLGRATKFSEYVTHGKDSATIEIELQKRPSDKENPVIRLQIMRENNARRFWLNGKDCGHKQIQALVTRLRIACDNLCQFLPQEKVAEFAGLTPVQLLHETLRAAAPVEMMNWQTQLKDLFKDFKNVRSRVESETEELKNYQARQQGLQADVDRLRERDAIKEHIKDMKKARWCAEYTTSRAKYRALNKKKKEAQKRLKELESASDPALQAVHKKEAYHGRIEAVSEQRKRALKNAETSTEQALRTLEGVEDKIKDSQSQIDNEKKMFLEKKAEVGRIRQNITKLEAEYKNQPPRFDAAEWNQKIREQEHVLRELAGERREIDERLGTIKPIGKRITSEINAMHNHVEALDSQAGQKASFLRKFSPDAYQGWEWLRENLDKFDQEVFGPAMLTCSLKDDRYSDLVQAMLQTNDFLAFTCQNREDHKKLSAQLYDRMHLSVSIRTCTTELQAFRPPVSSAEAKSLGLDGFAIDYLEGPTPVLAMLCSERFLHASGVALTEISDDQFHQLQNGQKINSWATGRTFFRVIRRREYGPDATTTSTRQVRAGRFWTDQPVDTSEKSELLQKIDEKKQEKEILLVEYKELNARSQELAGKEDPINQDINRLRKEKSELQTAHTRWTAIPDQINSAKANQERTQKAMSECRSRMANHELAWDELVVERAKAALHHKDMVSTIRHAHLALQDVQLRLIEAASDIRGLKHRNSEITRELDEKKQEIDIFAQEADAAREEAKKAHAMVERVVMSQDGGDLSRLEAMVAGKTMQEIDDEISAEEAKLELIHAVDPSILRQFEERAKKIAELTKENEKGNKKLERLDAQSKELMSKFEPKLDEIISRVNEAFGKNFERISCAGEVGLRKDEDFEQWAIEIKVKFRQNEELQLLNQHRQSGGERAVSTVFYIMALQSMAQAPFRVVDEINQGMDPRNERMVHERMVEIACKEHTSQYFLITPKLLMGLAYDDNMRILCIASGLHVPEEGNKLDFDKLIRKQIALKTGRVGA